MGSVLRFSPMDFQAIPTSVRGPLAHSLAFVIFCFTIAYASGFSLGSAIYALGREPATTASHTSLMSPEPAEAFEAWEAEVAQGQWIEPEPIAPQDLDLPLRWAV